MASKIDPALLDIIKQEATKAATDVYNNKGTMFGVADIPTHTHNGIDSNQIPLSSLNDFIPLSARGLGTSAATTGVLAEALINGQTLTNTNSVQPSTEYILPLPVIYGHGGGVAGSFNGGLAPEGTLLIFDNPPNSQLWWMSAGVWHGIQATL